MLTEGRVRRVAVTGDLAPHPAFERVTPVPRLFVANFDFEHRLACGDGTPPRVMERMNSDFCAIWAAVAEEGDAVWVPQPIDKGVFYRLAAQGLPRLRYIHDPSELPGWYEATFWGETEWARTVSRRWCLRWEGCDPRLSRLMNSRRFKHDLERQLGVLPPGAALAGSVDEVVSAGAAHAGSGWVLRSEFGAPGREFRVGCGPLTDGDLAWAKNRFRRGMCVTVEPRLQVVAQMELQFQLSRDGDVDFAGATPVAVRSDGGHPGYSFIDDAEAVGAWRDAVEVGLEAARAVASHGYYGPLGIDAVRYYDDDGVVRIRPLHEMCARWTAGRLALGLRRFPTYASACGYVFRPQGFRGRSSARGVTCPTLRA